MLSVKSIYFRIKQFLKQKLINKVIHGGNAYEIDMLYKELPKEEKAKVRAKMVEYYKRSDLNISDIAFKFRCSDYTVSKALKEAEVKADKFQCKLTNEERLQILEKFYNENQNIKVIAYHFNISPKTVKRIINKYTIEDFKHEEEIEEVYIPVTPAEETPATEEEVRENLNNEETDLDNLFNDDNKVNNARKRDEEEV